MNWIDVKDKLPEIDKKVLVCTKTKKGVKSINIAYRSERNTWHGMGSMSGVIAWMPLPDVYEG